MRRSFFRRAVASAAASGNDGPPGFRSDDPAQVVNSSASSASSSPAALSLPPIAFTSTAFMADWQDQATNGAPRDMWLKPSTSPLRGPSIMFVAPSDNASELRERWRCVQAELPTASAAAAAAQPLYKITSPTCDYYALRLSLLKAGFKRVPSVDSSLTCNLLWGKSLPLPGGLRAVEREAQLRLIQPVHNFQRMNHFVGSHHNFGCKAGMERNLRDLRTRTKGAFGTCVPRTWNLPEQRSEFDAALKEPGATNTRYIVKPARGSCGRGIRIVRGDDTATWENFFAHSSLPHATTAAVQPPAANGDAASAAIADSSSSPPQPPKWLSTMNVVQEYIESPLLVGGRKFDFRLFVGVTSFDPLKVYLHSEGLVRFAAQRYDDDAIENTFSHLTNYSIGRRLEQPATEERPAALLDLKWRFSEMVTLLRREYGDAAYKDVLKQIDHIIVTTLVSAEDRIRRLTDAGTTPLTRDSCFELYGFDIILDSSLRAWLIEVNTLPSLESSSALDYDVKSTVISDLLNVLMLEPFVRPPDVFVAAGFTPPLGLTAESDPTAALEPSVGSARSAAACLHALGGPSVGPESLLRDVVQVAKDEAQYAGGFRRIFPTPETLPIFSPLISSPTDRMRALWEDVRS